MRLPATITRIRQETPTIKSFHLDLAGSEINFQAGQWVDFFVTLEGAEAVGGYSITSSPAVQTAIGLAIRRDSGGHPVTTWLHEEARVGDEVEVSLGGDFIYEPDEAGSVILIGGGIGLTPLMSIIRAADELAAITRLSLVYSASSPDEILFRDEIEAISARNPRIRHTFTITRPTPDTLAEWPGYTGHTGRIDAALLRVAGTDRDALHFICGPPDMIRSTVATLRALGIPRTRIRYEQWW